eukprot:scaffold67225_cov48-Phaeocystis_antarctica.AAC.1
MDVLVQPAGERGLARHGPPSTASSRADALACCPASRRSFCSSRRRAARPHRPPPPHPRERCPRTCRRCSSRCSPEAAVRSPGRWLASM